MSFSENYLKLRQQRQSAAGSVAVHDAPTVPPVEQSAGGSSYSSNYLKLRQQRLSQPTAEQVSDNKYYLRDSAIPASNPIPAMPTNTQKSENQNDQYTSLMGAADFATQSKYAAKDVGAYLTLEDHDKMSYEEQDVYFDAFRDDSSQEDLLYESVNGNYLALLALNRNGYEIFDGLDEKYRKTPSELMQMSDDEVSIFNYIYKTQGLDGAKEYLNHLASSLSDRQRTAVESAAAQKADKHPILSSLETLVTSPFQGTIAGLGVASDLLDGGGIQKNADYNLLDYQSNAARGQVSQKIEEETPLGKVGSFAYNTGMSMGDSVARILTSAGNPMIAAQLAASGAATGTISSAKDRGLSDAQALSLGVIAGAAEAFIEKIGIDRLLNVDSLKGGAVKYMLKHSLSESGEEVSTDLVNTVADVLISKDKSQWQQAIDSYKAQGMSDREAFLRAFGDKAVELACTGAAAFLSGGLMSGGNAVLNLATNSKVYSVPQQTGKQTATQNQSTPPSSGAQRISDLVDEAMARLTGAPSDPVSAAVDAFAQSGTVTNKQAADILNSARAVSQLVEQTGMKLPDTASGRRSAVKQAIAQMAEQQATKTVDTASNSVYDNDVNQGGNAYAEPGSNISPFSGPLGTNNAFAGVQAESRGASFENIRQQRLYTEDNEAVRTRLSQALGGELERRGYRHGNADALHLDSGRGQTFEVLPVDANTFHDIFEVARKYTRNGELVDLHSVETTEDGIGYEDCENYLSADGMSGFSITPDGDLISVFNADASKKGFLRAIAPAVKSKVKTLDCYMSQQQPLHEIYGKVFGMKIASVMEHNMDYDRDGIAANHGRPKVAFMVNSDADIEPVFFGEQDYDAAKSHQVSIASTHTSSPSTSVGAAPGGFDMNSHLQYEHGTIPEGENPVRPDDLPKRDINGDPVSRTARTVKGAKATPDEFVDLLNKKVTEGALSYVPITNNATTQKAMDYIKKEGWDAALHKWEADVESGKTGADLVARGALLLNNAANAGDRKAWLDILCNYRLLGTNTAQGLQAMRILKTLEPSDQLHFVRRSIDQMVLDMHLDTDITIDPDLETEYLNAETDEARNDALKKIQKNVAAQIPSTWMDKWTALRYVNMLGNLRTQVRNVAGNVGMKAVNSAKNAIAAGLETIASKVSGGKFRRTKSFSVSRDLLNAAKTDFDTARSIVTGNGKYGDINAQSNEFAQGVQSERQIFKFAPLEGYRKATNWAMEKGDLIFSKSAYARALAGYLKANGVTGNDLSTVDTALMDDARLYAIKEAQEVTFRDSNVLSDWVSKVGRRKDTPAAVKMISEGVMPFRKTPANVLVRADEYSPLGIINSVATSIRAMQKDSDVTGAQIINSWAKTLTGTGIFGLGMLLNSLGCLTTGADEDKDKDAFDSMNGWQNYAIVLPDGTNFTIDFLTPAAMPLLMGAELMELIQDGGFEVKDLESALTSIAEPMIQMSMLQGVSDTLDNVQYAENNLMQLLISSGLSYLTQGLTNTLAGQIERTFEDSRTTTYVDKDSAMPDWLQRTLGKASAKIPGLDYQQIPYINAWGEEEENPEWYINGAYNTLSPSYIEKGASSQLTEELNRLNDAQSDVNVFPSAPEKTLTFADSSGVKHKDYNLSAEEYVALAKAQGQTAKQLVEKLISSDSYATLSDADKAKVIEYAYKYSKESAQIEVLDRDGFSSKWMSEIDGNAAESILRHVAVGTTEKYADLPIDTAAYVADLLDGILPEPGRTSVRDVQKMEAVVDDESLDDYADILLREIMSDSTEKKYDQVLNKGYDDEAFIQMYRQYQDDKKKSSFVDYCMNEMNVSKSTAETLYKIYSGRS